MLLNMISVYVHVYTSYIFQPIRFINLPAEITVNEDYNDEFVPIEIITYDYNYHLHDNVTCEMQFVPHEDNLFELVHDGHYDFNCK